MSVGVGNLDLNLGGSASALVTIVLDAIPSPVFLKDVAGRFLMINAAYERVAGLTRAQLIGRTVYDLYPRDLADRYTAADQAMYAAGEGQVYEVPMEAADGQRRDNLVTKAILRDDAGQVVGLIGTFTDLTELRAAERALIGANDQLEERIATRTRELARANALLAASLESTTDGILVVDADRKIIAHNDRFLTMWGIDPALAARGDDAALLDAIVGALRDPEGFRRRVDELYAHPDDQAIDVVELRDGRSFDRYALPMRAAGERPGRVWSFRDVTRERQLEAEMRHAQKMEAVGRLAGGVAHDFNNLLTVILANLTFVKEALPTGHDALADLAEIEAAAMRATDLTRQLLTFSRKQVVVARAIDLNKVLQDMSRMFRRLLGETIKIELHGDAELGCIRADPGQLEQVIANLCVNARDAMPTGGTLTLRTRNLSAAGRSGTEGGGVELTVTDTGVGMSDEVRSRIFEPFFTTKERGKGTGLGLSTVFGIVAQGGGAIEVESAPGQGATFRIVWPRTDEDPTTTTAPPSLARAPACATVLLVEDEAPLRRVVARQLCRAGYVVVEATHGGEAAQIAADHDRPFDLLLTDVVMPVKSGGALARELLAAHLVQRVLFMTGYVDEAEGLPVDASIMAKPFAIEALLTRVREVLAAPVAG